MAEPLDFCYNILRLLRVSQTCIDNFIFKLHYKVTAIMLLAFAFLSTYMQYFSDPIECVGSEMTFDFFVINTYCWIHSTFTVPDFEGKEGVHSAYPGVAPNYKQEVKYHKYYQWVCFILYAQSVLFCIPYYCWKNWENAKISNLVGNLNRPLITEYERESGKKRIVNYIVTALPLHSHNFYAIKYFLCEAFNFLNVLGQLWLMNFFLDGEFTQYGFRVAEFVFTDPEDRIDPMDKVFPKVSKCTFMTYGASGTIQVFDNLCVLPLNVVNEKIYVFLWFWFIGLLVFSGCGLLYRVIVFTCPSIRKRILESDSKPAVRDELQIIARKLGKLSSDETEIIRRKCQIGDFFLLHLLGRNMDSLTYIELLHDLSAEISLEEQFKDCDELTTYF